MLTARHLMLLVFSLAVLLHFLGESLAGPHRDEARHCTFNIPNNWIPVPAEMLAEANRMAKNNNVQFQAGYEPKELTPGPNGERYPYFFLQHIKINGPGSYEDIERSIAKGVPNGVKKMEGELKDLVSNISVGSAVLDRTKNRIILRIELTLPNGAKVQGVSYGFIGKEGILNLHCYALEKDFNRLLPTYNAMADSFAYDQGYEFVPGRGVFSWLNWSNGGIIGAIIGGLIGGVIALGRKLLGKA